MKAKKEAKKKTAKNRVSLKPRQAKLVEGIADGKSVRRAALDAGYSPNTAQHPADLLQTKSVRAAMRALIAPIEKIAQRINEGLDAEKTEFAKFEGQISDSRNCIDFGERRQYAELACKLRELMPSGDDKGTPDNPMIVRIDC
jgi:hypothetical protein